MRSNVTSSKPVSPVAMTLSNPPSAFSVRLSLSPTHSRCGYSCAADRMRPAANGGRLALCPSRGGSMPSKKEELPGTLKRSPEKVQDTYTETLDSAYEQYGGDEE